MVSPKYDHRHRQARKQWKPRVDALDVVCPRCDQTIQPDPTLRGEGWDLGHDDDTGQLRGPEHTACNRATLTHAKQHADSIIKRDW